MLLMMTADDQDHQIDRRLRAIHCALIKLLAVRTGRDGVMKIVRSDRLKGDFVEVPPI